MANNKQVISIGVQLDYKRELEDMIGNLREQLNMLKKSAKDVELSASLQKQINELEQRLIALADNMDDAFTALGSKVDVKNFKVFQSEIRGIIGSLKEDFNKLKTDIESAFASMDATKSLELVKSVEAQFIEIQNQINSTTKIIQDFYDLVEQKDNTSITVNVNTDKLNEAESLLVKMKKEAKRLDEIEENGSGKYTDDMKTSDLEAELKKAVAWYGKYQSRQRKLVEENKNGKVEYFEQQYALLEMQRYKMYTIIGEIEEILSTRDDISQESKKYMDSYWKIDASKFQMSTALNYVNSFEDDVKKMRSDAENAVESATKSINVADFKFKNGKINVPIEISVVQATRDKQLEESIKETVQKLQSIVKNKPIYIDVKLKTFNSDDKEARKPLTSQKAVREYFNATEPDIQELNENDMGRNFFAGFTEQAKEAYHVAQVVVSEIQKALNAAKISITVDEIKIDKDKLKTINEMFNKLFDEAQVGKFVEYFKTQFSAALQSSDFETALLTSLNSATDQWVVHFNESLSKISNSIKNVPNNETENTSETKNNVVNEEIVANISIDGIPVWKQTFLDAINDISSELKTMLSSSSIASVDVWKRKMTESISEVANIFINSFQATDGLSSLIETATARSDGFDELHYTLSGWSEADKLQVKYRKPKDGAGVVESLEEAGFGQQRIKASIVNDARKSLKGVVPSDKLIEITKILTDSVDKSVAGLLEEVRDSHDANREFFGALERGGLYDLRTGKFLNGYTFYHNGSYSEDLKLKDSDGKSLISKDGEYIDFHSHPASDKRFLRKARTLSGAETQEAIGSDLVFSSSDVRNFARRKSQYGIQKFAVVSAGKVNYLDFSNVSESQAFEIASEYGDYLRSESHRLDAKNSTHKGKYKGKEYVDQVFDFDEFTDKTMLVLDSIIKTVTGRDPRSIRHQFDVDEIKTSPQKMKDIGFLAKDVSTTSDKADGLTTMISSINSSLEELKNNGSFKLDTSSLDEFENSLREILLILQRIHEEFTIAFSVPNEGINDVSDVKDTYRDAISMWRSLVSASDDSTVSPSSTLFKDTIMPVLKQYYEKTGNASADQLWADIFSQEGMHSIFRNGLPFPNVSEYQQAISDWYSEYVTKTKDILNINEGISKSQQDIKLEEGSALNISSDDLTNIASHLEKILSLIQQIFDASDAGKIKAQWSAIEDKFNSIAKDDGSIDARKKEFSELIGMIQKYQQMGGKSYSSLTDNEKTIEKIRSALAKQESQVKQTPENEETNRLVSDKEVISKELKTIETVAKEFDKIITPIIPKIEKLIELLSKEIDGDTFGVNLSTFSENLKVFNDVNSENIKAVVSALRSLSKVSFSDFQSTPAFASFINDLNRLQVHADVIKDLAEIIKQTKGKVPDVDGEVSEQPKKNANKEKQNAIPADLFSQEYATWAANRKAELEQIFNRVGETAIKRTASGIVEMTNVVQAADGSWKQLTATMDNTFNVFEKDIKPLSDAQGMKALGLFSDKEEKQLQRNLTTVLSYSETYEKIMAKAKGFGLIDNNGDLVRDQLSKRLTGEELKVLAKVDEYEQKIEASRRLLSGTQLQGQTDALYESFQKMKTDAGDFGADRIRKATDLLQELDNEVQEVVADLGKFSDPGAIRAIDKVLADYAGYVSDYVTGDYTQETLDKRTGQLLSKYRNVIGWYSGSKSQDAYKSFLQGQIRSMFGDFDFDWGKGIQNAGSDVYKLTAQYRDLDDQIRTVTASIDTSTMAVRVAETSSAQYVNGLDKFFTSLKAKAMEGLRYLMAYVSIQDIWRYFKQGVQVIREFDTALTEMRKVSDEAVITLKSFQTESFDIADAVGTTAVQIQQSTADFMRLGNTLEEAKKNASTANILLNVSEFEGIDEATTSLIAMEAAYKNLSGTEIIDKLNNIGNHYAISTDGIASALQRSASALTTAGNDIDESIALITAGNAILQDPEKVGNGLRTIALRLTGTKAAAQELEEIGEETDGMIQTESKLRKTIMDATKTAKTPEGFDILDKSGQYKSTYEILKGISEIWDDIKKIDMERGTTNQNLLLETMAGKNRANILASILQNPELLNDVYVDSQVSEGSAQEELEKYLDSIDAKIQKFKNATQEFAVDFLDSDVIKFFIDFGTAAVHVLDELAKQIDFVAVAFGGLLSVFMQGTKYPLLSFGKDNQTNKYGFKWIWDKINDENTKNESDQFKSFVDGYQKGNTTSSIPSVSSVSSVQGGAQRISEPVEKTIAESEQIIADVIASDTKAGVEDATTSQAKPKKRLRLRDIAPKPTKKMQEKIEETFDEGYEVIEEIEGDIEKKAKLSRHTEEKSEEIPKLPKFLRTTEEEAYERRHQEILAEANRREKELLEGAFGYNEIFLRSQGTLRTENFPKFSRGRKTIIGGKTEPSTGDVSDLYGTYQSEISDLISSGEKVYADAFNYLDIQEQYWKEEVSSEKKVLGYNERKTLERIQNHEKIKAANEKAEKAYREERANYQYTDPRYWDSIREKSSDMTSPDLYGDLFKEAEDDSRLKSIKEKYKQKKLKQLKQQEIGQQDVWGYLDLNDEWAKEYEKNRPHSGLYSKKLGRELTLEDLNNTGKTVENVTQKTESLSHAMSSAAKQAKSFTDAFDEFRDIHGMDQKTIDHVNEFRAALQKSDNTFSDTYDDFKKWEKQTYGASASIKKSLSSIGSTLVSTFASAAVSMGITFLLESAVKGIYYLATLRKQLIQTGQEARKVINDSASATQTASKTIKSLGESSRLALNTSDESKKAKNVDESIDYLAERYTRLKKGVGSDNENVSLTDAEYQEFLNISNQIAEVMPDLQYGTDASGNAILSLGDKAADASKKMKDFYDNTVLLNSSEISSNMRDALRGLNSELEQLEKDYGKISATIDETEGLLTISDSDRRFMSETGRYIQKVSWEDIYSENKDAIINLARSRKEELISLQNEINSLNDTIDSTQLAKLTQKLSEFGISTTKHKDYAEGAMDFGFYAPGDQYYESFVDDASKSEHLFENGILNRDVQKEINNELVNAKKNAMEQIQQLEKYYIGIDQVFMNLAKSSSSYITSSDAFNNLDYELQERLSSFYINDQAHFKELYDQAGEDVGKYENLLIDSYLMPLNELAKGDRQQQIQDLIKEGSAGKTLEAYREYLNNKFQEIFGESYNTNVDYAKLFGFDFKEKELDFIAGRFGGDLGKEIVDKLISERDIADIDLAYKTLWEDTEYTIDTYDKLNKKMEENRNLLAEETSYLNDYTAAQGKANTEKYNTVAEAVAAESANMAKGNANEDYAKLIGRFGGDRSNLNSMFEYGDAFRNAVADYKKELNEVADLQKEASAVGIDYDFNRTLFGNVDTKDTNRLIKWTKDSVKEYKDVLESWGESDIYKSVMAGNKERSTVLGGVKEFNGIPVAYTPILVDDKGARLLNFSEVMGYLDEITQRGKYQFGEDITLEEIIGIDAKGINGIKGLIADIGDSAFITAQYMHFTGAFGSLQGSLDTLLPYLNEMNVSIQTFSEYASMGAINLYSMFELFDDQQRAMTYFTEDGLGIYSFMKNVLDATKDSEELRDAFVDIGKDGVVSFKKNEKHIKKLSERLNISTEAAGYLLDAAKDIGRVSIGTINTQAGSNQLNQFLSDIEAVNAAMSEMSSNGYLSNATITNLVAANGAYASALINTSSGIILNSDAVRELNEQNAKLRTAEIQKSEQELTNAYKENTQTIANNLRFGETLSDVYAKLQNEANLSADEAERLNTIWGAYQYNQQIEQDITNLQREQSEIRAIVSLMGEYKTALSSPDLNDNFLTTVSGKEGADKLFEQGWVGQDDFVTYAKLIGHNGDDAATAIRGYQANIERIGKYLTEDRSGVLAFFDDAIAKSEELDSAWVVWDDENGYILDGINNMNEFADAMGVTTEFAENMVLALHDAGQLDVNLTMITDGIRSDLGAIGTDVLTVNSNLQNLLNRLANVKKSGGEIGGTMIDVAQAIQQSVLNGFDMSETIQKYNEVGGNEWRYNADSDTITTTAENAKAAYDSLTEAVKNYSKAKTEENRQAVRDSLSGFSMFNKDTFDTLKLKTDIDFEKDTKGDIQEKLMKEVFGLNQGDILRITAGIDLPENASEKAYELVEKLQELDGMYVDPEVSTEEIDTASGEARKLAMELLEMGDQETLIALGFDLNEDGFVLVNEIREKLSKEKVDIPATVYVSEQTATSVSQLQTVLQEVATVHEGEVIIEDENAQETVDTLAQTILDTTSEEQLIKLGVEMKGEKYTKEDIINYYGLNGLEANVPVGLSGLNGNNVDVHVNVPGAAEGAQEVTALNRALTSLGAKGAISVSIDTGVAQSQVQGLRDTLTALNATVAHPSVYMALAGFYSGEKVVTATLDGLSQKIAQPHVSMEYGAFRGGASDVRSQMSGINGLSASPTVRINDYASSVLYNIKNLIDSLYSRTITITTVRKNKTEALGSFNSWDTEATGTANAYAGGTPNNADVAIKHNETALVNELGYESIVRNGKWSLIPGGAHFMNLKKGDIIFNADQTRELIENGRVLSDGGRGKLALASGTVNAYYNSSADTGKKGYADLLKTGGSGRGNTSSGSGSGSGSGNGNSGSSSKAASDAKDTAETFDWIEIKIDRLEREIEHFDTILSSTYQSWGSRNSALANEIKKTTEEINVQYKQANNAYKRYIQEANKAANKMTKKQREIYIPALQNGTLNISTIKDEKLKENLQTYQEWYEKALDCKYAIDELQESLSGLYETAFEMAQTYWQGRIDYNDTVKDLDKYLRGGYHSSSSTDIWDKNVKNINFAVQSVADLQKHLDDAVNSGAIKKSSEAWYSMKQAINEAKLAVYEYEEALLDAIEEHRELITSRHESSQEYQRNRGSFGGERYYATEEIANAKKLASELKTSIAYNIGKNGASFIGSDAYLEQVGRLSDAMNKLSEDYKNLIELDQEYYERLIKHNDEFADHNKAIFEGAETFGEYESIEKYRDEIRNLQDDYALVRAESAKMEKDLADAVKSGAIQEGSTEWLEQKIAIEEVRSQMRDYKNDIEEANQKIIELEYAELFDRVIEKMDKFIDKIETINGLLTDEMMYDYDTGKLTESGALAIVLNNNALDTAIEKLQKYAEQRQRIIDDYNADKYGKETFDKNMAEVEANINSALNEVNDSRNKILDIIKNQTKAELDAINKTIDARKEALQKKKEYYDYDKQLKDKNKDIQLLQQQIQALDGVADAESRAKKARLEAQLAEMQEDLNDTVQEHVYSLQTQGLDDLQKKLSEDYEKYVNEISKSASNITDAINTAVETSGQDIDGATQTLNNTLMAMGAGAVSPVYETTTTGQEFEEYINSENTDRIIDAINMVIDNINKEKKEDVVYENAQKEKSENELVQEAAKYNGTFSIAAGKDQGFVLDITSGSTKNGANVQLYKSNNGGGQQFQFIKNSDGTYSIKNVKSGLLLNVAGSGNVTQVKANGSKAQKWKIVENTDGSVSFKSLANGKMLDVSANKMTNKTNIGTYEANGSTAQKFFLKRLALGSKGVGKTGTYLTQENGSELLVTKYGMLTPLSKGDGVVPAEMTKKLYDIAMNYDKFDASGFKLPNIEGTVNNKNTVNYTVGDINIAGNTNLTMKDLDTFRKQIVEDVKNAIASDMRKYGYKPVLA